MKIMFILDFDHTLVNSKKAYEDAKNSVCSALDISSDTFDKTYEEHKKEYGFHFPLLHILSLTKDNEKIKKGIEAYETYYNAMKDAVFDDSFEVLNELRRYGKVIIISAGERAHQYKAIIYSNLHECCDAVRVVEEKSIDEIDNCIKKLEFKPDKIFSIADRPSDAHLFEEYARYSKVPVFTVRIRRPEGKYFKEEGVSDAEFASLRDFLNKFKAREL